MSSMISNKDKIRSVIVICIEHQVSMFAQFYAKVQIFVAVSLSTSTYVNCYCIEEVNKHIQIMPLSENDILYFVWYLIALNLICVQIILFISLCYQTKR